MPLHLFHAECNDGKSVLVTAMGQRLQDAQAAAWDRLTFLAAPPQAIRFVAMVDRPVLDLLNSGAPCHD